MNWLWAAPFCPSCCGHSFTLFGKPRSWAQNGPGHPVEQYSGASGRPVRPIHQTDHGTLDGTTRRGWKLFSEVLDGKLGNSITTSAGPGNLIHLPPSYRGLSAGGDDIVVYRRDGQTLIFFFDFRGILDSNSRRIYRKLTHHL